MAAGTAARAVLVIGARGVLGSALVRAFEDAGWRVVQGARQRDGTRGSTFVDLDRPETVAAAIARVDLVVDAVPHPELTAERVVLREGGALIDVSMRPAAAAQRLRAETTSARGTVVLNAGRSPGVSNLVVADLLASHPDADAIEIVFSFLGGRGQRQGGRRVPAPPLDVRAPSRHGSDPVPGARRADAVPALRRVRRWLARQPRRAAGGDHVCPLQPSGAPSRRA